MKTSVLGFSALLLSSLWAAAAEAQHRVSVEVGGMVSAYSLDNGPAVTTSAIRVPDSTTGAGGGATMGGRPADAIAAFELRPTVTLHSGLLFGIGLRIGQAGLGDGGHELVGTDAALGYARRFGRFLPFLKGVFGFNSYDNLAGAHKSDFRADAVLGSRFYATGRFYVAAAAFAGYGDRYGGTVSVGGDVVLFPVRR